MTWVAGTAGTNQNVAAGTSLTASVTATLAGTIEVAVTTGQSGGVPASLVVDDNGVGSNTFTRKSTVADSNSQLLETWHCMVAVGGTVTVRVRCNPTPGTTQFQNCSVVAIPFTGSDAASVADGTGSAQAQSAPGTGADAVSSGSWSTATDGDLIFAACVDTTTGNDPGAHGAGFTDGGVSTGVVLRTEWKTQTTHGSVAGTFTATTGTDLFITGGHAVTPAAGVAPSEDPNRRMSSQIAGMRRPSAMPQVIAAGLALFMTGAQGPTVPQGDPAMPSAAQALIAYRGPAHLVAQPEPPSIAHTALAVTTGPTAPQGSNAAGQVLAAYREAARLPQAPLPRITATGIVGIPISAPPVITVPPQPWPYAAARVPSPDFTQGGAAPSVPISCPPVLSVPPQPWPYVATMLPEPSASQWGIPNADLIFDRLKPTIVASRSWPYASSQPAPLPLVQAAAAVVPPPVVPFTPIAAWPYIATMLPEPVASAFGQSIPPSPVLQWAVQTPWPYVSTMMPVDTVSPSAPVLYTFSPAINPMRGQEWPYVGAMLPAPTASQWSIADNDLIFDRLWPLMVEQQPWPHAAASFTPSDVASLLAPVVPFFPTPVRQFAQQPWPHWLTQPFPQDTGALPPNLGMQIPPSPVLQWATQTPWPYASTLVPVAETGQFTVPVLYTFAPAINPVRGPEWPYVATMVPEPTASEFGQAQAVIAPSAVPQFKQQAWAYLLAMQYAGPAATMPAIAPVLAAPLPQQGQSPWWPHALVAVGRVQALPVPVSPGLGIAAPQPQLPISRPWPHAMVQAAPLSWQFGSFPISNPSADRTYTVPPFGTVYTISFESRTFTIRRDA
jgi:hypothetical protein